MDKKYAVQGIIGCALFGIGDWLLGFVNPDTVAGASFYRYNKCLCIFLYVQKCRSQRGGSYVKEY
ncbi:MAG: hypothetical protein IJV15_10880 [Lachnospiraceae bacterium]|nr:hypothetical protein [Lachnospiraceae bacterium]